MRMMHRDRHNSHSQFEFLDKRSPIRHSKRSYSLRSRTCNHMDSSVCQNWLDGKFFSLSLACQTCGIPTCIST